MTREEEIETLQQAAASRGLPWSIAFEAVFGEPPAFRLVATDGIESPGRDVIGETFEQALDCITLTAHMLRRTRRQKGK